MGYHTKTIAKGVYGDVSKIHEELEELQDAITQNNPVMALVELSDLIGAIDGYLQERFAGSVSLDDLVTMARATQKAFNTGHRK